MEHSVMLAKLKAMTGEQTEEVLSTYLDLAGNKILRKAYPYDDTQTTVPEKYHYTQLEVAAYLLNKRGAEGETAHNENGISRSYESATVPDSMLKHITPHASVLGGKSQ